MKSTLDACIELLRFDAHHCLKPLQQLLSAQRTSEKITLVQKLIAYAAFGTKSTLISPLHILNAQHNWQLFNERSDLAFAKVLFHV